MTPPTSGLPDDSEIASHLAWRKYIRRLNVLDAFAKLRKATVNPVMPELNSSAQRCLPRFFTGDFNI
jgi:hypothetical protein